MQGVSTVLRSHWQWELTHPPCTGKRGGEAPELPLCALNQPRFQSASGALLAPESADRQPQPRFTTQVNLVFGGHFLKWSESVIIGKRLIVFIDSDEISFSSEDWNLGKTCICCWTVTVPDPADFSDSATCKHGCVSFFSYNYMTKSFNILEDLYSLVNQYFPSDQATILQNHAWIEIWSTCTQ